MRKIDDNNHRRFITALEGMVRDMDTMGFANTADGLVVSRDELEDIYRRYRRKIEELNNLIGDYYDLFERKHSEYVEASRLRQKENTRTQRKKAPKRGKSKIIRYEAKQIITA